MKFKFLLVLTWGMITALLVKAQVPSWSVDASQYNHSMIVVGVIKSDKIESQDVNDKVGAFVNGECRGVASPIYQKSADRYVVYLLVYNNESTADVSFKLYDADKSATLDAHGTIKFAVDSLAGNVFNPYVWSNLPLNNEALIKSFSFEEQRGSSSFQDSSVYVTVNENANVTGLVAEFEVSEGATVKVDGNEVVSGNSEIDFSSPVKVTVISEDEQKSRHYWVKVTVGSKITLTESQVFENVAVGTEIGTFKGVDPTVVYKSFKFMNSVTYTDNSVFFIQDNKLKLAGTVDFEKQSSFKILVEASDNSGNSVLDSILIHVIDINEAPVNLKLSSTYLTNYDSAGTMVGEFFTEDQDKTDTLHTYELVSGDGDYDNVSFKVEGNKLFCLDSVLLNKKAAYYIRVSTNDVTGLAYERTFRIDVRTPTAVEREPKANQFEMYPNPAVNNVSVEIPFSGNAVNLSIFSVKGAKMFEATYKTAAGKTTKIIDVANLPTGIYIVEIKNGEKSLKRKLIINN